MRKLAMAGAERAGEEVYDLRARVKKQVGPEHKGGGKEFF